MVAQKATFEHLDNSLQKHSYLSFAVILTTFQNILLLTPLSHLWTPSDTNTLPWKQDLEKLCHIFSIHVETPDTSSQELRHTDTDAHAHTHTHTHTHNHTHIHIQRQREQIKTTKEEEEEEEKAEVVRNHCVDFRWKTRWLWASVISASVSPDMKKWRSN